MHHFETLRRMHERLQADAEAQAQAEAGPRPSDMDDKAYARLIDETFPERGDEDEVPSIVVVEEVTVVTTTVRTIHFD